MSTTSARRVRKTRSATALKPTQAPTPTEPAVSPADAEAMARVKAEWSAEQILTGGARRPAQEAPGTDGDRDEQGRFARGNAGGPGNPFARQVAQLRATLIKRVTEKDINEIADTLILMAKTGDLTAMKLLFQYVLGKPAAAVNPDTLDIDEFQQIYAPRRDIQAAWKETSYCLPPHVISFMTALANHQCLNEFERITRLPADQVEEAVKKGEIFMCMRPKPPDPEDEEYTEEDLAFMAEEAKRREARLQAERLAGLARSTIGDNGHRPVEDRPPQERPSTNGGLPARPAARPIDNRPAQPPSTNGGPAKPTLRAPKTNSNGRIDRDRRQAA